MYFCRFELEEISGKDLNSFFNQWYYKNGHPKLHISYDFDEIRNQVLISIKQADKIFNFPLSIDIYESGTVANHFVQVTQKEQTFTFNYTKKPNLINCNANHTLLCEITEKNKTLENYIFQYKHAPHYVDRREAILELAKHQDNKLAFNTLTQALNDAYYELRILALEQINLTRKYNKRNAIKAIEKLATSDSKTKVQGVAINILGKLVDPVYKPVFERGMKSDSYSVKGNATLALYEIDKEATLVLMKGFDKDAKDYLASTLTTIYIKEQEESEMAYIASNLLDTMFSSNYSQYHKEAFNKTFDWVASSNKEEVIQGLVSDLVNKAKRYNKYGVKQLSLSLLRQIVDIQTKTENTEKEKLIFIAKKGMASLIN